MAVMLKVRYFGIDGYTTGSGSEIFLPEYLDWMPIELKAVWFLKRGLGNPLTTHALLESQGEQMLVNIKDPLTEFKFTQLQEIDNGLEAYVQEYASHYGISRTPRNQ